MTFNKWDWIGGFCSTLALYLLFFDKIPFGPPWGVLIGMVGLLSLKQSIIERFGK